MGMGWSIHSFDRARFDAVLGAGASGVEARVADALLWDVDGYFDDEGTAAGPERASILASEQGQRAQALARHIARRGVTYQDLNVKEADLLDELISGAAAVETLQVAVGFQGHTTDGPVGMGILNELLLRARKATSPPLISRLLGRAAPLDSNAVWLPLFMSGRRFGSTRETARHALYLVLDPTEVQAVRAEIAALLKLPPTAGFPVDTNDEIRKGLIWPLDEVIESGRWALLTFG
jgi:hypothetical protein